ncbi:Protein of unknown function DUF58 [Evansella caseinilytica]|uniref:DUF58 domain-containing protein n=1 Tax=Evansella caseinilytica TaxID=1503961 RepID=A0A1H3HEL5_9BACI|nr:DUF58 domain-containing protein [Evansella caseinilytica]SDY13912.1 Protein of unknown function DUF58 [Evansella caseinilytica]
MLLPSDLRMRLARCQWRTSRMKRGLQKGSRRSTMFGSSLDFSDFRAYQPGDDVRQIDWNVYARTKRHYIKRFLDEQELSLAIYLDCSLSMGLEEEKWRAAQAVTAAIAHIGLANDDRVSVIPVSKKNVPYVNKKGIVFSNEMVRQVESYSASETDDFFASLSRYRQPKAVLSFLISDCFKPAAELIQHLKAVQAHQQLRIVHLLSETERNPALSGDLKLIDVENGDDIVQVSMNRQVLRQYQERLTEHSRSLEKQCNQRGIGYVQVSAGQPLEEMFFFEMRKLGWLA